MGEENRTIKLYASQTKIVHDVIENEGVAFSKRIYVEKKYGDANIVFLTAYDWFVGEMEKRVPKPEGAEYPYWLYENAYSMTAEPGMEPMELEIPREQCAYFDVYDWNKVLSLKYIGEDAADEARFAKLLKEYGVRREMDAVATNFYPELKQQVQQSWQRLFRYHDAIAAGLPHEAKSVQAASWCLRKEWLKK